MIEFKIVTRLLCNILNLKTVFCQRIVYKGNY